MTSMHCFYIVIGNKTDVIVIVRKVDKDNPLSGNDKHNTT